MRPAVFLDRDGTINIDKNYVYKIADFEYIHGSVEALRDLQCAGYLLIIITNQSGIARGFYTEEDYKLINEWMLGDLNDKGVHIDGVYYCPHLPDAKVVAYRKKCICRKPGTALFYKAIDTFNIDVARSYAIGDKYRDLAICKLEPVQGILISESNYIDSHTYIRAVRNANNLKMASELILEGMRKNDNYRAKDFRKH